MSTWPAWRYGTHTYVHATLTPTVYICVNIYHTHSFKCTLHTYKYFNSQRVRAGMMSAKKYFMTPFTSSEFSVSEFVVMTHLNSRWMNVSEFKIITSQTFLFLLVHHSAETSHLTSLIVFLLIYLFFLLILSPSLSPAAFTALKLSSLSFWEFF